MAKMHVHAFESSGSRLRLLFFSRYSDANKIYGQIKSI